MLKIAIKVTLSTVVETHVYQANARKFCYYLKHWKCSIGTVQKFLP